MAANCWQALANLPEVDSARIGVVGHSYGGKWAMFASCLFDKFACAAWSDPGIVFDEARPNVNYWEPWYLGFDPVEKRPARGVPTASNPRTGASLYQTQQVRDIAATRDGSMSALKIVWTLFFTSSRLAQWQGNGAW